MSLNDPWLLARFRAPRPKPSVRPLPPPLAAAAETLPNSCPDCGAGIVISTKSAFCDANKYASYSGAGDCRWSLTLTPDLRRQADEALAAQRVTA